MNLIFGDGLLGSSVIGATGWNYVSRKKDDLDFTKPRSWKKLIPRGTSTIINLIANTDTYSDDFNKMFDVNYRAVINLVEYCNENNIKLVHYSTDYVYVNSMSHADEKQTRPQHSAYANSKLLADEYIEKHSNNYLICRGSQKVDPFPYEYAYTNVIGNFDTPDTIADIFVSMITSDAEGIYNIGTSDKSMFDLAIKSNESVKPNEAPIGFPTDVTMNLDKMNNFLEEYGRQES